MSDFFGGRPCKGFKDALSATASGFFGLFKRLLDFILSSPVHFFSRWQFPFAGLDFLADLLLSSQLGRT